MPHVFVSYRRSDSQHITDRIYERLAHHFSKENVFKDVDSIPLGTDFRSVIADAVKQADVFLAVVGPTWIAATDERNTRRLDDPSDFVRIETEVALANSIPVIPIMVGNASIPPAQELPESLRDLHFRQGQAVRPDPDFQNDMSRLISSIEKICGIHHTSSRPSPEQRVSPEFVELVKHRAEMVLAYIEEQKQAAIADAQRHMHATQSWMAIARRYEQDCDLFLKLHGQYLAAVNDGRTQVAHEILGDMYKLIYRCRHEPHREPPSLCMG